MAPDKQPEQEGERVVTSLIPGLWRRAISWLRVSRKHVSGMGDPQGLPFLKDLKTTTGHAWDGVNCGRYGAKMEADCGERMENES